MTEEQIKKGNSILEAITKHKKYITDLELFLEKLTLTDDIVFLVSKFEDEVAVHNYIAVRVINLLIKEVLQEVVSLQTEFETL